MRIPEGSSAGRGAGGAAGEDELSVTRAILPERPARSQEQAGDFRRTLCLPIRRPPLRRADAFDDTEIINLHDLALNV